jgi:hypothetical protein
MFDTHHRQLWRQMLADHQDERLAALCYLSTLQDELAERSDFIPGIGVEPAETGKDVR